MTESTADVVVTVNDALGTDYALVRRLAGGLQAGAFELRDGDARAVLKWTADPSWAPRVHRVAQLVRRARAAGYPTPAWLAVGTTPAGAPYHLQEFVDGTPLADASTVDHALADELIAICELQRGLVDSPEPSWSDYVRGLVFQSWDGIWEAVRAYDDESAEVIAGYERICSQYADVALPADDLVHGDLNVSNLLVRTWPGGPRVAGIVDIEAAAGGTRAYDLVALAASASRDGAPTGVDERFLQAALRAGGLAATAVCAASAYASIAAFVREVSPASLPLVQRGGRRILELLESA